jgi:ketosteroid isomerase-like protein
VETGLELYPDEVIAQGPPWRVTLCVRGRSSLDTEDRRVYENRYVIWGRVSWGRLREYEVYEDTQATEELDAYLARRASTAAA